MCDTAIPPISYVVRFPCLTAVRGLTLPGLYLHLGDCLFRANRQEDAGQAFAKELKLYPDNLQARMRLGGFYLATNKRTEFVELFKELVRLSPTAANIRLAQKALTEAGETEAASAIARSRAASGVRD